MHLNTGSMRPYFSEKPLPYNLRNGNSLQLPHVKLDRFGINSFVLEEIRYRIIFLFL